jgi:hypothetical protein
MLENPYAYSPKHQVFKKGQPAKYNNCLDLDAMCELFFQFCDEGEEVTRPNKRGDLITFVQKIPPTFIGLALFLGFNNKSSLLDYRTKSAEFSTVISRAKARCEFALAQGALAGDFNERAATRFLAAYYNGYKEKTEIEVTAKHESMLDQIDVTDAETVDLITDAATKD